MNDSVKVNLMPVLQQLLLDENFKFLRVPLYVCSLDMLQFFNRTAVPLLNYNTEIMKSNFWVKMVLLSKIWIDTSRVKLLWSRYLLHTLEFEKKCQCHDLRKNSISISFESSSMTFLVLTIV